MKIPGLIANKKEDSKLTSAELQAKRDSFEAYIKDWKPESGVQDLTTNSIKSNVAHLMNQYNTGVDPYKDAYINTPNVPYHQPMWEYIPPQNPGPFGKQGQLQTQDMARYLQEALAPKKSDFELLLNSMFDTSEKEQFLIDVGYELIHNPIETTVTRKLSDGTVKTIKGSVDEVFLKEITVKFKGLLLAKGTLRIKFPDVQVKDNQEGEAQ